MRTFRTIILENSYVRATLLPGLGGRIISLFDKRTGSEILRRHTAIEPQPCGRRGASVREGIQLFLDGQERLNALGNVSTQIEFATDDNADAVVWIAETFSGTGLSFHLKVSLPPDRAELRFEARVLNRWLRPQDYNGLLSVYLGDGKSDGNRVFSSDRNVGIAMYSDGLPFDGTEFRDGCLRYARFSETRSLAPRQVDAWSLTLVPMSGLGSLVGACREASVSLDSGVLRIQCTEQRLGHKLLLLTEDGQTLEAKVDLYPENLLEIPLNGLKPVSLVLKDPGKREILRLDGLQRSDEQRYSADREQRFSVEALERSRNFDRPLPDFADSVPGEPEDEPQQAPSNARTLQRFNASRVPRSNALTTTSPIIDLQRAAFDISTRHLVHTLLGMKALAEKRNFEACELFEQALMYNADDPLAWWAKALALRLSDEDNQAELLNAHYLAPMEPALRAESFLSQPISLDAASNPLLAPLEENPEEFIEVACLLIECGLFDQASRWIDEAIRHRDLPMLRYLMAYCLMKATKLNAEASDQIRLAAVTPIGPPFPFRDVERVAIDALREAFPGDERLITLAGYLASIDS